MKNKVFLLFCWLVLWGAPVQSRSQVNPRKAILAFIDKMAQMKEPPKGVTYFMDMSITSFLKKRGAKPLSMNIKLFLTKDLLQYNAGILRVFQDSVENFVVVPNGHKIFRNNTTFHKNKVEEVISFQRKLITHSRLLNCKDYQSKGVKFSVIRFQPERELRDQLNINDLEFVYNHKQKRVVTLQVRFQPSNKVATQVIKYHALDFKYKGKAPHGPASKYVISKDGKLRKEYNGYQLIDNRIKNNG